MTTFNLHTLGWKSFQDLCATILTEVFGQTFQTFSPGRDGGRDGAFRGEYRPRQGEVLLGNFTAQCKFTSTAGKNLSVSDISTELPKMRQLTRRGLADIYVLLTNQRLSAEVDAKLRDLAHKAGVRHFLAFGEERIEQFIRESPRLRHLVPRVYGLGDLSEIFDERAYAQAEAVLLTMQNDLRKFVPTYAYKRSMEALADHGCVFLLGEPACGKTATAATLVLAAIDAWKCRFIKLHEIGDLTRHWNTAESKQLFWVDDVFGATQYQEQLADQWNRSLPELRAAHALGARFVFTSRDYIYAKARAALKLDIFPVDEMQLVIDVEHLTPSEKRSILYNHVKMGNQPTSIRTIVKNLADRIVDQTSVRPEVARRLGNSAFTPHLSWTFTGVRHFFRNPESFLHDVVRQLSPIDRSALGLLFIRGGLLEVPTALTDEDRGAIEQMGGASTEVTGSLAAMEGSFVRREHAEGEYFWSYKHPTIGDAVAAYMGESPMLLDLYIRGVAIARLVRTITCGEVAVTGSALVVPRSRFPVILSKLYQLRAIDDGRELLLNFLGTRCDSHFFRLFVERHPPVWHQLICEESPLDEAACRFLHTARRFQLLPPSHEKALTLRLIREALQTLTALHLRAPIRDILSDEELAAITSVLIEEVRSRIDDIVEQLIGRARDAADPSETLGDALRFLEELALGTDDLMAASQLEETVALLRRVIDDVDVARSTVEREDGDDVEEDEDRNYQEALSAVFESSDITVPFDENVMWPYEDYDDYYYPEEYEEEPTYMDHTFESDLVRSLADDEVDKYERLYEGGRSGIGHLGVFSPSVERPMYPRGLVVAEWRAHMLTENTGAAQSPRPSQENNDAVLKDEPPPARSFFDDLDL